MPEHSSETFAKQEGNYQYASETKKTTKEPEGKYKCNKCGKIYKWKRNLLQHDQIVHTIVPSCKLFKCENCNYASHYKSDLARHIGCKHMRQAKFKCDDCGNSYARKDSMLNHKKYVCKQVPRFVCKICGYKARSKKSFWQHTIKHQHK